MWFSFSDKDNNIPTKVSEKLPDLALNLKDESTFGYCLDERSGELSVSAALEDCFSGDSSDAAWFVTKVV